MTILNKKALGGILSTLDSALSYAAQGEPVLPCHGVINGYCTCGGLRNCKPGKHPLTLHGVKDATTDLKTIQGWWERWSFANVAIATGGHLFVLDIDPRHGGDATLAALIAQHGALPQTPAVATGGGGTQHYLRYPSGVVIRSRSGIAKGIDVRGDTGYVLAPPSIHVSGNRYEWLTSIETPLADAPAWLLAVVSESPTPVAQTGALTLTMGSSEPCDLASHPGAGEGKRNDKLCHLLGVHLSRGDSPATVEALALAWAQRCDPPFPESEVFEALRWAERKREEYGSSVSAVRTSEPTPAIEVDEYVRSLAEASNRPVQPPPLSSPDADTIVNDEDTGAGEPTLHADAYHGLAGEIISAIAPETEADPAGILLSLLTAFGNAVGNGPHFAMNAGIHHTNLFNALVGDSASSKGQTWNVIHHLMRAADPGWADGAIAYGLSSGEGLVDRVKDDEPDDQDEGLPQFTMQAAKRLLCVETEFAKPITAMRREGNTLSPLLRSAWDAQPLEVLTRGKSKLRASNALVSVIAHITPEELKKLLGISVEVANGFVNRFLWVCVRRSKFLPEGGDPSVLDAFVDPLREALSKAKTIGRVERDAEAKSLWAGVYESLSSARPGASGMATSRAHAQTLRLSLLYALLDGSEVVRVEHLRAALAVWWYCEASARRIFGGGSGVDSGGGGESEPLHLRLLNAIVRQPGINRRGLHEATGNRVKASDMDQSLAYLATQGLAHFRMHQTEGGGRPGECWYPGAGDTPPDDGEDESNVRTNEQTPLPPSGFTLTIGRAELVSSLVDGNADAEGTDGAFAPSVSTSPPHHYPVHMPKPNAELGATVTAEIEPEPARLPEHGDLEKAPP
jgi:hypothetical protein